MSIVEESQECGDLLPGHGSFKSQFPPIWSPRIPSSHGCLCILFVVHAVLLVRSAALNSPTMDEPFHLASGVRHWTDGKFDIDRGNPPLVGSIAAIPVVLMGAKTDWSRSPNSFLVGSDFLKANGSDAFRLFMFARWVLISFGLWGLWICYAWSRELFDERCGLLAATLWCFCPMVLAHGALVTGDMAATVTGLAVFRSFWKWLRRPDWTQAIIVGLLWGLAELAKFLWLMLYGLLPLLWIFWRLFGQRQQPLSKCLPKELLQGLLMVVLSLDVLNLGYLYEGFGEPLVASRFGEKLVSKIHGISPLESRDSWLAQVPMPLPAEYLAGLGEIDQFVSAKPMSYLCGEYRSGGVWYFYLYGWAVKLPLGTWLIIGLTSIARLIRWRQQFRDPAIFLDGRYLLIAAFSILIFVTLKSGVQFLRYTLPVLPFVLIWASQLLNLDLLGRWLRPLVVSGLAWSIISSLVVYPHSLSYFNELVGSRRGYLHLIDDSYDWGQDLLALRDWLRAHPEVTPLKLAYWGWTDPRTVGIDFELPPLQSARIPTQETGSSTVKLAPGWYAVSIGLSHGRPWIRTHDGQGHEAILEVGDLNYFQRLTPVATAGYSIQIFHVTE